MATSPSLPSAAVNAIALIKAEHLTLARLLGAMQKLVAGFRDPAGSGDPELFDAMLRYIENVPDRLHHPKEDRVLFPALEQRSNAGRNLIEELESDHARGAPMLGALRKAFKLYCAGGVNGLNQLATAVDEFAEFYWHHMRKEEQQLLPLAEAHLTLEDWQRVESAFGNNKDPLFGGELADDYRQLYECIVVLTPHPLKTYLEDAAPGAG